MIRILTSTVVLFVAAIAIAQVDVAPDKPEKKSKKAAEQPRITDPAVLTVLESKPTTPAEQFDAARLLVNLGQPELAKPLLTKLIEAKLDDAKLAALAEKFGSPTFLRFGRTEALAPEAEQFATAVLAAASRVSRDPARLEAFVQQLTGGDAIQREDAAIALKRAGSAAVGPLLTALLGAKQASEQAVFREIILRLSADAVGPLSSALDSPDANIRSVAVELLGRLKAEREVTSLVAIRANPHADAATRQAAATALTLILGAVPSVGESERYLERAIQRELKQAQLIDSQDTFGGETPMQEVWRWNEKAALPEVSVEAASNLARQRAARAARALAALGSSDPSRRRLILTAVLEEAKHRRGLDRPLAPEIAKEIAAHGVEAVNNVLVEAMALGNLATAISAVEVLGEIGSLALLEGIAGQPSPLAQAAHHPDRRLRFAATDAILKLKPTAPFAGASAVSEGLTFFAGTSGHRKALVAHPRSGTARQLAAYLTQLGYEAEIATTGREAFALATSSPDYEVAFVHAAIDHPRADDLLAQFRKDPRTMKLPVALIAIPEYRAPAERLASGVPLCHAFDEPQDEEALKYQVDRLLTMPGCQPVPLDVRKQHAAWAIAALVELAERPVAWIDTRAVSHSLEHSLYAPGMTAPIASLLASAGTATGQSQLVQLATRASLPLATRELAAIAFARSVMKYGILLTSDQILAQYDLYNSNAGRDPETHKVMLIILEALEQKSADEAPKSETLLR